MNRIIRYFNLAIKILEGRLANKRIPASVVLCVTNRCNLRCVYCYAEYYDRNHAEFTTKQILSLIDELYEMGTRHISLNGGEALMREDIGIIVDKVNEKNMLCQLTTNGLLVKNKINVLKKVDSLCLSLDGDKRSTDLNRGAGTYDKIVDAIEFLNSNKINFYTNTVLTKNNKNAVDEVMELAGKYGFKAQFSLLRKEDSPDKAIVLDDKEAKEIIGKILKYKKAGFPILFLYDSYENAFRWPFSYNKLMISGETAEGYKPIKCYMKRFSCHIEANGLVYPCIVLVNKFKALNFLEVGFKKAWEHMANNDCKACYNTCCSDVNLIFGFRPNSLWDASRVIIERSLRVIRKKTTKIRETPIK